MLVWKAKKVNYHLVLQAFKSARIILNPKILYVKLLEFNNIRLCVEDDEPDVNQLNVNEMLVV